MATECDRTGVRMHRLAILGASGHGKVVADTALDAGWREVVFFDDAWPKRLTNGDWPVLGGSSQLIGMLAEFDGVTVGIGDNRSRLARLRQLETHGVRCVTVIHPSAQVSRRVELGPGCVVFSGAVIQIDSRLGGGCIVNTLAGVDHDCTLAAGVHICPGAHLAGGVVVGEGSWIGIGAAVRQFIKIGRYTTVGAGAAVVADIGDDVSVVGVPARPLHRRS